ncbi:MAG: hypothetical protein QM493_10310 [Sulfurovum sp.]
MAKAIGGQNTTIKAKVKGGATFLAVGCIQALGDIDKGEREVITLDCLNNDDITKILGSLKLGNITLSYNYNPDEPEGNGILDDAFNAPGTVELDIVIELSNSLGTNGTQITFEAIVPKYSIGGFAKNDRLVSNVTLEINSKPDIVPAA